MAHQEHQSENISDKIENVATIQILWKISIFYDVKDLLNQNSFKTSHWEGEENWAIILKNGIQVGFVWINYPLIICNKNVIDLLKKSLTKFLYIQYIEVCKLDAKKLIINKNTSIKYLNIDLSGKNISAEEIWFYTNN